MNWKFGILCDFQHERCVKSHAEYGDTSIKPKKPLQAGTSVDRSLNELLTTPLVSTPATASNVSQYRRKHLHLNKHLRDKVP